MVEFFKALGIYSAFALGIGGIVIWLGKLILGMILNKDLERFKSNLLHENEKARLQFDKEMESFRNDLGREAYKHTRLHDITLQVVEEMYTKIADLDLSLRTLLMPLKKVTGDDVKDKEADLEKVKEASNLYNDFLEYFNRKKIYLPKETCEKLEQIRDETFNTLWEYNLKNEWNVTNVQLLQENYNSAANRVKNLIPAIKASLEEDFRVLVNPKLT